MILLRLMAVKNLLKLAILLGCFLPSLSMAERGTPPKGKTMQAYVKSLKPYLQKWGVKKVSKRAGKIKSEAKTITNVAKAYAQSGKASSLDTWDEWYDGSNLAKANKEAAMTEMLLHSIDCGGLPKPTGICIMCSIFPPIDIEYEYYLPVHLVEITDTPWKTGYATPSEIERRKKKALPEKYGNSSKELAQILKSEQFLMRDEIKKYGFYDKNISISNENIEKVATAIFNKSKDGKYNFTTGKTAGGVYAFPHVFDAGFNERYKDSFTNFWGHDGAELPQRDKGNMCGFKEREKRPVESWFAEGTREFWYSSYALRKTGAISGVAKIQQITIDKKRTGRPHNYNKAGNFSPDDILPETARNRLEDKIGENCGIYSLENEPKQAKCLNGQNGEKGPTVALVKDSYFTRASMIAAWRGLFWVTNIVDDDGRTPQSSRVDENTKLQMAEGSLKFQYHPFFNKDYKGRPRSRMQVLSTSTGGKYNGIVNGCSDFKGQKEFIPDWSGPKFGDANSPKKDSHNNQTVLVQWQYMKNCRKNYRLLFSPKSSKQYWF